MAALEVIALDTSVPQLMAPQAGDTYTFPRAVEMPLGTANGVLYLNASKVVTSGSALTFDGTTVGVSTGVANSTSLQITGTYTTNNNATFLSFLRAGGAVAGALRYNDTQGDIEFGTTTSHPLAFIYGGSEQMRLTSTGLGIGTSSPSDKLDVFGGKIRHTLAGGGVQLVLGNSLNAVSLGSVEAGGDASLAFYTNTSTERMRLDQSGNLGLGVTPSAWGSSNKAIQLPGGSIWAFTTTQMTIGQNVYDSSVGTFLYANTAAASRYRQIAGEHAWFTAPSGTAGNAISFTQAMTLDASGNLGVGTTSPTSGFRLDVQATTARQRIESTTGTNQVEQRLTNTGGTLYLALDNSTGSGFGAAYCAALWHTGNYPMLFATNNTERARITSGGYFKASNNGSYVGSTGAYHELVSNEGSSTAALYIRNTNAVSPAGIDLSYSGSSPNGTGNTFLYCQDSTALRASIRSNGGLANYQSNDVDLSDARTKKDITPAPSYWSKIGALEIVTYKYKDQTHDDINVGVIAQQVEQVEPVWVDADGFGETPEGEEPLKTVYTKDITFAAIKALQEAMIRIEQLEARLAAAGI